MFETTSQSMAPGRGSSSGVQLQNIQQSGLLDLSRYIITGLQSTPKTMPSLLLWDNQGLRNFDAWTNYPAYYPKRCEWEILRNYGTDIASQFPVKSTIIELGCGSLDKTAWLLASMEKKQRHVLYYALDVSDDVLHTNLGDLKKQFAASDYIMISGLSGTYSDCAEWLANSPPLPFSTVTFLWLGNSVANMTRDDASALMGQLQAACVKMSVDCNFLISADGCQVEDRILKAYDPANEPSRVFFFHGLHHANALLGQMAFKEEEWDAIPKWNKEENELRYYYSPKRDIQLEIDGLKIEVKKGELVYYFMSGKWNETQIACVASNAGLSVGEIWKDDHCEYGEYFEIMNLHFVSYIKILMQPITYYEARRGFLSRVNMA
ncbi:histidine-specific methyltransferase [Xylaria sp. FL1042]|nr:histidine-specific methyltransferase [Xylaria sp. FL1042]